MFSFALAPQRSAARPHARSWQVISWQVLACCGLLILPFSAASDATAKTPGKKYCFNGKCHRVLTLAETQSRVGRRQSLIASFYSDCKVDRYNPCGLTSSGAVFRPHRDDNAASPIYPNGTKLLVWNPANKHAAIVRIDNAGPYKGNRTLDLSRAAAKKLGFLHRGVARLAVQVVSAPSRQEATYRRRRVYAAVPGYIGRFPTLEMAAATTLSPNTRVAAVPNATPPATTNGQRVAIAQPAPSRRPDPIPLPTIQDTAKPASQPSTMTALPTVNLPQNRVIASSIRLPVQLVRAELPTPNVSTTQRSNRVAALTEGKREPRRREKTKPATERPVAKSKSGRNEIRQRARTAKQKLNEKVASTKPQREARPEVRKIARQNPAKNPETADQRVIPTPAAAQSPTPSERPRLAWRQKYFSMNRGGT